MKATGLADTMIERSKEVAPVLVGFDPSVSFGAGERLVNDNEQSLILAGRRIVRGLGCCVRFICHSGKENARNGSIDQYSARGGSALADGARMVTVLREWNVDAPGADLYPPPEFAEGGEQIILYAQAVLCPAPASDLAQAGRVLLRALHRGEADPAGEGRGTGGGDDRSGRGLPGQGA